MKNVMDATEKIVEGEELKSKDGVSNGINQAH